MLSEEEEAALLAEYGVLGLDDVLLTVPAASQFRSDYGDTTVFLTGGALDAEDSSDDDPSKAGFASVPIDTSVMRGNQYPLDAFVIKHTGLLSTTASSGLTAAVGAALGDLRRQRRESGYSSAPSGTTGTDYAAILRQGRSVEQRAAHIAEGQLTKDVDLALISQRTEAIDDTSSNDVAEVLVAERLLAEANTVLSAPASEPADSDKALAQHAQDDVSRTHTDAYDTLLERRDVLEDDDNDAEQAAILRDCATYTSQWRAIQAHVDDKDSENSTTEVKEASHRARHEAVTLGDRSDVDAEVKQRSSAIAAVYTAPPLFAFEMELEDSEKAAAEAWEVVAAPPSLARPTLAQSYPPLDSAEGTVPPAAATAPSAITVASVLQSISEMEVRDAKEETLARDSLRRAISEHHAKDKQETTALLRERTGMISLQDFVKRVDLLIPPAREELAMHDRQARATTESVSTAPPLQSSGTATTNPPSQVAEEPIVSVSLEAVRKQAAREVFAIEREAKEARAMREEDRRMENWMDHLQDRREELGRFLAHCQQEAEATRAAVEVEESTAFKDLRIAEQRQLLLLRQAQRVRLMKATEQLAEEMLTEHAQGAQVIVQEAERLFSQVAEHMRTSTTAVYRQLFTRFIDLSKQRAALFTGRRCDASPAGASASRTVALKMDANASTAAQSAEFIWLLSSTQTTGLSRLAALDEECRTLSAWVREHHGDIDTALNMAQDTLAATRQRIATRRHWRPPQHNGSSRPTTGASQRSPSPPQSSCDPMVVAPQTTVLDRERFCASLGPSFSAAQHDLVRAPQYLYAVSIALENLQDIDCASLARTELQPDTEEQQQRRRLLATTVRVPELVRDLDLGSNAFAAVPLPDLLESFPSLLRLRLSDNRLSALTAGRPGTGAGGRSVSSASMRGVAAARESALGSALHMHALDVSANTALHDISVIGRLLNRSLRTLNITGNNISACPSLSACSALMTLEAKGNPLRSFSELHGCRLLHTVNVCESKVEELGELPNHLTFLRCLYASQTPITVFASPRTVFLTLTQLFLNHCRLRSIAHDAVASMPFLSVLHLEGNQLTTVAGLVGCLRLDTLNLASNYLSVPTALSPLRVCTELRVLDVRGNAVAETGGARVADTVLLTRLVRALFPQLRELNAEAIQTSADTPPYTVAVAQKLVSLRQRAVLRACPMRPGTCERATRLLAHNTLMCDLRSSLLVCETECTAGARVAEDADATLAARFAACHMPPLGLHQLALEEDERGAASRLESSIHQVNLLRRHAEAIANSTGSVALGTAQNRVTMCPNYWRRARQFAQSRAVSTISRWLYGLVLIRRARAELAVRRQRYRESEGFRRDAAARRIQPVWRGAVLRSRLRRIVGPGRRTKTAIGAVMDDDDDDTFVKVDENFELPEMPQETMETLFQRVLAERREPLPTFSVPPTIPGLYPAGGISGIPAPRGTGQVDILRFDDDDNVPRAGTAPINTPAASGARKPGGGRAQPLLTEPARPASTLLPRAGHGGTQTEAEGLEAQWGTTVAAQIRKKNKKMNTVHKQYVREQFALDPLAAKRQLRGEPQRTKTPK